MGTNLKNFKCFTGEFTGLKTKCFSELTVAMSTVQVLLALVRGIEKGSS